MVRGRITEVKSIRAEAVIAEENARWVLDGDRGITFSSTVPEGSRIVSGEWWSETYDGPPLVSLESDIAKGLNLTIGDMITVNILGRSIQAKIANLRRVDWQSLGINFVLVFSPNTFKGAPVSYLATLTDESGSQNGEREAQLLVDTAQAFPAVSAIRVREALESVRTMIDQLAVAIRGVAGITILASILVLAGAVGASQRRRIRDAVILKTLGASRFRLLTAFLAEFAMISLAASFFGLIAGLLAAWAIVAFAFRTAFTWPIGDPFATAALAVVFAVGLGLIGTWRVLDEKPARHLRAP
jgi:putative ABC transport system permease protein